MAGVLTFVVIMIIIFAFVLVVSNYFNISDSLKDATTQGRLSQFGDNGCNCGGSTNPHGNFKPGSNYVKSWP